MRRKLKLQQPGASSCNLSVLNQHLVGLLLSKYAQDAGVSLPVEPRQGHHLAPVLLLKVIHLCCARAEVDNGVHILLSHADGNTHVQTHTCIRPAIPHK